MKNELSIFRAPHVRISLFIVHFSLFISSSFADCNVKGVLPDAPVLCGNAVQGGLIYGESDWMIITEQPSGKGGVSKDGIFVFGIPMDADKKMTLLFCRPGEGRNGKCKSYDYEIGQRKYKEQKIKVDDKFVSYPPEVLKRIESENESIAGMREVVATGWGNFADWRYPFSKKYPISGVYGARRVFNGEPKSPHRGLDIAAPKGASVRAIAPGKVVLAMDMYLSGKTIMVSHGFELFSVYAHLDKIKAKVGDVVSADSIIGSVGATGRASGPHLHLGFYYNQTALDPELLFPRQ